MSKLSHLDQAGNAHMVDVSAKDVTSRSATARACVTMRPETLAIIVGGTAKKGDVFATARIAGIQAAKRTGELIPLAHPLPLTKIDVEIGVDAAAGLVEITAEVRTVARTGVEMEAMTAASVAALTLYDMVKAVERGVRIENVRLLEKSGGRSGDWTSAEDGD